MQSIAVTHPGLESVSENEIKELIKPNTKSINIEKSVVIFEPKKLLDLCRLCYKAQSLIKVILLKKKLTFNKQEDIFNAAKGIDFSDFVTKGKKFMVKCARVGEHDFSSQEIEEGVGGNIKGEVDLDNPDIIVYVYLCNKNCYIGIDFSGFDLSKRQYRIFNYKDSLKATVAYSMLRIADYNAEDYLVDPFCATGTIPIEAALFASGFPVNYFNKEKFAFLKFDCFKKTDFEKFFEKMDKEIDLKRKIRIYGYDAMLGYAKAGQKNAKIAGINKIINISRADIDWIETKVDKGKADKIVACLPEIAERNKKVAEKLYKEFFYQSEFILNKKGIIVVCATYPELVEKYSSEYEFRIKNTIKAMQGKKELSVFVIQK